MSVRTYRCLPRTRALWTRMPGDGCGVKPWGLRLRAANGAALARTCCPSPTYRYASCRRTRPLPPPPSSDLSLGTVSYPTRSYYWYSDNSDVDDVVDEPQLNAPALLPANVCELREYEGNRCSFVSQIVQLLVLIKCQQSSTQLCLNNKDIFHLIF